MSNSDSTIEDLVGFHLRMAHGAVYRHFTDCFDALDLTQKQVSLLWLVGMIRDRAIRCRAADADGPGHHHGHRQPAGGARRHYP
jgi:hypothetical protein